MRQIIHYLNPEEKLILENFLLYNELNSKKDNLQWNTQFLESYGVEHKHFKVQKCEITHIWDRQTNLSMAQHFYQHKKFKSSNFKLKFFNNFNPNWNHRDNFGENILHNFARGGDLAMIEENKSQVEVLLNHCAKSYHMVLSEHFDVERLLRITSKSDTHRVIGPAIHYIKHLTDSHNDFMNRHLYHQVTGLDEFAARNLSFIEHFKTFFHQVQPHLNVNAQKEFVADIKTFQTQNINLKLESVLEQKDDTIRKLIRKLKL